MLSVGTVGLSNVSKSALFNALAAAGAPVCNYPFTTVDSNVGTVVVPDPRLAALARTLQPGKTTPCAVRINDLDRSLFFLMVDAIAKNSNRCLNAGRNPDRRNPESAAVSADRCKGSAAP
jgi:hypothetical protein